MTCGVSLLVRLARAGRVDVVMRGLAMGLSEGWSMAHNASTVAMGDGNLLRKAGGTLRSVEMEGAGLLEVSAAASASNSASVDSLSKGEDSIPKGADSVPKGEEGFWLVTGASLTVTPRGLSRQGAGAQEAASERPALEAEEGPLKESERELPPTVSAARADGTSSGMAVGGMKE